MTGRALARARTGDEDAFRELTDPYRHELQLHCYRIVGSTQEAEDLVQETLLAAWRGLEQFNERASIRTWLYRIATNRCIDALRASARRPQGLEPMTELPEPSRVTEPIWLEPYPDVLLEGLADGAPGPEARYEAKEATALAFVAGLQHHRLRTFPSEMFGRRFAQSTGAACDEGHFSFEFHWMSLVIDLAFRERCRLTGRHRAGTRRPWQSWRRRRR